MQNDTEKDLNYFIDWIEKSIAEERINYYEYSDFKNVQQIGKNVFRSTWKSTDLFFSIKSFNNRNSAREFVEEIKLYKKFDFHPNMLKFYGITKMEADVIHQMNNYSLVLEYADSGTLKTYLNEHFNELDWNIKCRLAFQLASVVECMHERGTIHCNLHSNNILVHRKNIKLADFGLSKDIDEKSSDSSKMFAYLDPKSLNNPNYKLNEKSDVYSIGILMWQISSGRQPFYNVDDENGLTHDIINGKKEDIVDGTPIAYSNLYRECWKYEPNERPDMRKVVSTLETIISHERRDTTESSSKLPDQTSVRSNLTDSSFEEPIIVNINNIIVDKLIKKHNKGFTFEQIKQLINQQMLRLNQSSSNIVNWLKNQVKSQYIWLLGLFYYYSIDVEDNSNKVFELFSKAADDNYSIAQVYLAKCYNDGYGTERDENLAFNWYQKAVENGSTIGQLYVGHCYEYGIGVKQNEKDSIYWYKKAANNGNTTAMLYLANCYRLGKGVEKDETKAFKCYEILALQEISDAQNQLGNCFYDGIGTNQDKVQAKYWYDKAASNGSIVAILKKHYDKNFFQKILSFENIRLTYYEINLTKKNNQKEFLQKAADNGNRIAQFNLGNFYKNGEGIEKDERKAFELYKKSAKQGNINANFQLGHCYDKGIGVDIYKVKAFELYKIAAEKENSDAQNYLGLLYENGQGTEKDTGKAFYWFDKAAKKENEAAQCNLGRSYQSGIGVEKDEVKAFKLYKELSGKGNVNAIFQLGCCYELGKGVEKNESKAFKQYKKAANKEFIEAQYKLGNCYYNGTGIVMNKEKAFELYKKAAEKGSIEAQYKVGNCYNDGIGIEADKEKAFELYKKAAEKENTEAQYKLGNCYNNGIGTVKNKKNAFELYKKAAEKGNPEAQISLALLYENGEGTEENLEMAFYWYQKSAENEEEKIKIVNYDRLNNIELNDNISSATMATNNCKVAIKKIDNNRIFLLQKINEWDHIYNHSNIVEFLAASLKDDKLLLIMPFANNGNLRNYIKSDKLSINSKMEIAIHVTNGIMALHKNNIVHENLNPNNILIFDRVAKISILPLPYKNLYGNENLFDNIGYVDPNTIINRKDYKKDKSVDIYSLGTLLWEIMSENVPYSKDQKNINITQLMGKIKEGYREDDVASIPVEYIELYKKCWDGDSSKRPSINSVSDELLNIKC